MKRYQVKRKKTADRMDYWKVSRRKVQVDVKYVPKECMSPELQEKKEKFYQYTTIDEFTRLRYTCFTN